jgi:site-specific recombinase XerD
VGYSAAPSEGAAVSFGGIERVPKATSNAQLTLMEAPTEAEHPVRALLKHAQEPITARQSAAVYGFGTIVEHYLGHLRTVRRCSPRTLQAYRSDYAKTAKLLEARGHSMDVREITTGDLELCVAGLGHLAASSVERLIYALASLFGHIHRNGIIDASPVDGLARPQKEHKLPRVFTSEEANRLFGACRTAQEILIVALLRYCGLRRNELLGLDLTDVAADYSSVRVSGKGRKQRDIPVHPSLRELLSTFVDQLEKDQCSALIRNSTGNRMSPTSFYRLFSRLLARAGLAETKLTPHGLRHHFATALLRQGADIATVAALLGHSNVATTSRYVHADAGTKRAAIEKLPPLHVAGGPHSEYSPPTTVYSISDGDTQQSQTKGGAQIGD